MTETEAADRLNEILDESDWSEERIARWMAKAQTWVLMRPVFAQFRSFVASRENHQVRAESLSLAAFCVLYRLTHGTEEDRFADVLSRLSTEQSSDDDPAAKPTFRMVVVKILSDGQWYTAGKIASLFREACPATDESVARTALRGLLRRPPHGKEVLSKRIGRICQYRMRDAAMAVRRVPTQLVTGLVEGIEPIIEELKEWGRHSEYEMSPSAIHVLAVRLEKVLDPLQAPTIA